MKQEYSNFGQMDIPLVGFGTYQLSDVQAESCVREALRVGFKHIDSAEVYGNEVGTGKGIKASGVKRDEIFVTTKLFPGYQEWEAKEKTYDDTIETLKRQLVELQLDFVDLYLIHTPFSELRLEQWQACLKLKELGLATHVGVSNYNIGRIQEIRDAGMGKPDANQIEFHPICAQPELTEFMKKESICPIAYSSLAPLASWRMEEGQGGDTLSDIKLEAQSCIREIAENHGVAEAKVLLRWVIQRGYSVLTKSSKLERIKDNLDLFNFEISSNDMETLNRLNQNKPMAWAANGLNPMEVAAPLRKTI